jgi:CheY-like chemotaxis protein
VVAEVSDSGKGIAVEDLVRIFNPFEQVKRRESSTFGGLGLGLALTKGLVELHGGTIEAKSEGVGQGAVFCVTFPLTEASTPLIPCPAVPLIPAHLRALRILLVEDHGDTSRILARLLRSQGHEVQTAGDLHKALELSRQWEFDLLLSDLGLPDGSGRELMRQLRSTHPKTPGIAMSGYGTNDDIRQSLAAGFEEHLVKPLNIAALRAAINRVASNAA